MLAGVSIAIMSGGRQPAEGLDRAGRSSVSAFRGVLMLVLGLLLNNVFVVPVWVIIACYGACSS